MIKNEPISKIIVICGPTGAGKSKFAIKVSSCFGGEIVSADSMQVYRYMNIGTAKASVVEQMLAYHHMIDVVDPDQPFSAAIYSKLARAAIKRIIDRQGIVFIVGGTGLYIKALIQGLFYDGGLKDTSIRSSLSQQALKYGSKWLHNRLLKIDKIAAGKIHENDLLRIVRALEVFEITGKTITEFHNLHRSALSFYKVLKIGILWSREELYQRINQRVNAMLDQGFVEEVKRLLKFGYSPVLKSMNSLGYRHISDFLNTSTSWEETVRILKRDHRRYAKRQMTWFNADPTIYWLHIDQVGKAVKLINDFLEEDFVC